MSPWKSSCLAAFLGGLIAAGSFYYLHHLHAREAAALRTANNRLELLVGRKYHEQQAAKTAPAISATVTDPAPPPASLRAEDYRNEGRGSPLAALQTFAWACDRGDTTTVAEMLCFEGGGRAKVAALLAGLPENSRPAWKNPEEMAATLLTEMYLHQPFPSATIIERAALTPLDNNNYSLAVRGDSKTQIQFQRTDSGWSYLIPEAMVDRYIAKTKAKDR